MMQLFDNSPTRCDLSHVFVYRSSLTFSYMWSSCCEIFRIYRQTPSCTTISQPKAPEKVKSHRHLLPHNLFPSLHPLLSLYSPKVGGVRRVREMREQVKQRETQTHRQKANRRLGLISISLVCSVCESPWVAIFYAKTTMPSSTPHRVLLVNLYLLPSPPAPLWWTCSRVLCLWLWSVPNLWPDPIPSLRPSREAPALLPNNADFCLTRRLY